MVNGGLGGHVHIVYQQIITLIIKSLPIHVLKRYIIIIIS